MYSPLNSALREWGGRDGKFYTINRAHLVPTTHHVTAISAGLPESVSGGNKLHFVVTYCRWICMKQTSFCLSFCLALFLYFLRPFILSLFLPSFLASLFHFYLPFSSFCYFIPFFLFYEFSLSFSFFLFPSLSFSFLLFLSLSFSFFLSFSFSLSSFPRYPIARLLPLKQKREINSRCRHIRVAYN